MQTARDAEIANWICRIGAAGIEHVARRFGMHRKTALEDTAGLAKRELAIESRLGVVASSEGPVEGVIAQAAGKLARGEGSDARL